MKKTLRCVLVIALLIFFCGSVQAKYILNRNFDIRILTAPFYFDAELAKTELNVVNNTATVNLTLKNFISDSEYTNIDTTYDIKLEDARKYSISLTDANVGTLLGNAANENQITINFNTVENALFKFKEEVTLVITSLSPYQKQIRKNIILNKSDAEIVFSSFDDFRPIIKADCTGYYEKDTFENLYSDNNGQFEYTDDGGLIMDNNNPVSYVKISDANRFKTKYSINFTIKADVLQDNGTYGNTIVSIGNSSEKYKYLLWVSIYQGYLQIYSYRQGTSGTGDEKGFLSYDISSYNNKLLNVQIVSYWKGDTGLYINGEKVTSFESGGVYLAPNYITVGDLRPLRGLKFTGTLYDLTIYDNIMLNLPQIRANWEKAQTYI